jgi:hypothetical protein
VRYRVFRLGFHTTRHTPSLTPSDASCGRKGKSALSHLTKRNLVQVETGFPMLTRMMRRYFIPVLLLVLLALLWPSSPPGSKILLGFAVCVGAMLGFQAGRAGEHFGKAGHTMVPHRVKFEN